MTSNIQTILSTSTFGTKTGFKAQLSSGTSNQTGNKLSWSGNVSDDPCLKELGGGPNGSDRTVVGCVVNRPHGGRC